MTNVLFCDLSLMINSGNTESISLALLFSLCSPSFMFSNIFAVSLPKVSVIPLSLA